MPCWTEPLRGALYFRDRCAEGACPYSEAYEKKDNTNDKVTAQATLTTSQPWYAEFERYCKLIGIAPRSQDVYLAWVRQIDRHYPEEQALNFVPDQVLDFLVHLKCDRDLAGSTINQAVSGLRHFYNGHLDRDWDIWRKIKIVRGEPLPHFLTRPEVDLLLDTFRDGRYRAFFTTVYQTGMRLSEARNIKLKHINAARNTIYIPKTKNRKAREVPVTPELLTRLRKFWSAHRNPQWLFPGVGRGGKRTGAALLKALHASKKPVSNGTIQKAINAAAAECGLTRTHDQVTTHTLRHSYATHLLEGGASVVQVAAYLGHSTLKQTMVYLHLTEISEEKARAALYTLAGQKKAPR